MLGAAQKITHMILHKDGELTTRAMIETAEREILQVSNSSGLGANEIAQILKKQGKKVISESADPRMIDELARGGVNIVPVQKYKGSIEAGIAKTQTMKIHVTKDSTNVIKEFKNYTYEKNREGKYLNRYSFGG